MCHCKTLVLPHNSAFTEGAERKSMVKRIHKKIISFFLALVMTLVLVPATSASANSNNVAEPKTISYSESATVSFTGSTYFQLKTTKDRPVTIVYSISGSPNTRYTVNIVTPIGVSFTDKIYANGGQKAKTFSSGGPGNYYISINVYSGNSSRVTANVYTF